VVTMVQLRDARWGLLEDASKGWKNFADQARYAGMDIRDQGKGKLDEHWKDRVGEAAGKVLGGLANEYDIACEAMQGVAMILTGLGEAVEIAQRELKGALELADQHYLFVDDDGTARPFDHPDSQGDNGYTEAMRYKGQVEGMIRDATEAATQADDLAADQLRKLGATTSATDSAKVLDELNGPASQAEVEMMHFSLPHGQSPEAVAAWWNSLTEEERHDLELALPAELVDLDGVPQDVKDQLKGPGPLDRTEIVRYATQHWNDGSLDWEGKDNCTNFASTVLSHAGMPEDSSWTSSTVWKLGHPTDSWGGAGELHDHLLEDTNSHEVPRNEARPGDLIFLKQAGPSDDPDRPVGDIHHTAVVTSVTPDGVIHYTQHSGDQLNVSLDSRELRAEQGQGDQDIVVVRVDPTEK
jgi:putative amidase-like protein